MGRFVHLVCSGFSRIIGAVLLMSFIQTGCEQNMPIETYKQELLETDRRFSELSAREGTKKAFLRFMADSAVIFRDGQHPIRGRTRISDLLKSAEGSLTWEPYFAEAAESGDLGYTLGAYTLRSENGRVSKGHYVSIWKRQQDNSWKYVFDSGIQVEDK